MKTVMNPHLFKMLKTSAEADKAKAMLTIEILSNNPVGIGDHSTSDFYNNAEEALRMLAEADDRLDMLKMYFEQ
jgi:hypothetical protein